MKLRVGIVGLGPYWATRHLPALHALSNRYEVRAVCDPVAHRAEQVARELGARAVDGFRQVAASEDVEAILMLSARWYGALPIAAACDHEKAIYCAASVDLEAHDAAALRDRVRRSGIAFMAEFPRRLAPATIRLQELMATRLGPPKLLFCNQRHTNQTKPASSLPNDNNGGANMRHMVEMVDWCRYIVGKEANSVTGASHLAASEDYQLMTLDFSEPDETGNVTPGSGPLAQVACGSYVPAALAEAATFRRPADMQVICENGIAFIDLPSTLVWFDQAGQHTESLDSERPVGEQLLMHFHRAVSSLVLRTSSLDDAYQAISLVIAGRKSHAEGRRVGLET